MMRCPIQHAGLPLPEAGQLLLAVGAKLYQKPTHCLAKE